jgi:8-oxo-dGTP pyrophosphatase MutT (NUDIX family)
MKAAGVAFISPVNNVLFVKRAGSGDHEGEWCLPGGGIDGDETASAAARREAKEEVGHDIDGPLMQLDQRVNDEGVDFTTFTHEVDDEFDPVLNHEHSAAVWQHPGTPPEPLHPGVAASLPGLLSKGASDAAIALDRDTVRAYDADGRLHVKATNISKANVCPYWGREIPLFQELGLDPNRKYYLLRDPEELKLAADSFNNLPILSKHVPVTAASHQPDFVIGSTGTDAKFDGSFLRNSLVLWAQKAIDNVENEQQKELSSAYRYRADMTPGTFNGERYDGVMRDIIGNHVALVKTGRAGPDVIVGDSQIEEIDMSKVILSHRGALTLGALSAYLVPKLAQDAKLDLSPLCVGLTAKNFAEKKTALLQGVRKIAMGKLAQDADLSDLDNMLDGVVTATPDDPAPATDLKSFLASKGLSPEDVETACAMMVPAVPAPIAKDGDTKKEDDKKDDDDEEDKKMVSKPAMDAAIEAASKQVRADALRVAREIREAERAVRSRVGDIVVACDSAEEVYATALKTLGVKTEGIHPSAFKAILDTTPIPGDKKTTTPRIAADSSITSDYAKRFPGASRIGQA